MAERKPYTTKNKTDYSGVFEVPEGCHCQCG